MACLLGILFLIFQQSGPSVDTLVDGVDRTLKGIRDFSSEFEQIQILSNQRHAERGLLKLKREGGDRKLRLEYLTGDRRLFVSNGKTLTQYTPAIAQAEQMAVKDSDNELIPLMLLLGRENLLADYPIRARLGDVPRTAGHSVLRLTPRNPAEQPVVTLEVDPKTFLIHRLALEFSGGERNEYIFKDPRANTRLDSSEFEFTAPPGVQVKRR
jgi:outer membrane lipoprotein-sorting protein